MASTYGGACVTSHRSRRYAETHFGLEESGGTAIKSNLLTAVNDEDYQPPFPLTTKLNKLTIKVDRPKLSPDIEKLEKAEAEALDGTPLRHVQAGPQ